VALQATKWPTELGDDKDRAVFEAVMWVLHLAGGAVWIGGLVGLTLLALPGGVPREARSSFWSPAVRIFSLSAMTCVAAIGLSGLFLYWEHVDAPGQLFSTMYGNVLGVKILIFGAMLLLGVVNQFVLHPRIDAARAAGDTRSLHVLLARRFPAVIATEVVLGLSVLLVAPFLHGSARNQAFQSDVAKSATSVPAEFPRIDPKVVSTSTWVYGTLETVGVVVLMVGAYLVSGRMASRRVAAEEAPRPLVGVN
jgi:uncharacterized membrane protein